MSIQLKSQVSSTQAYHIYYDLEMINNDTTGQNPPQILRFSEIRNTPYLMSPENYFMSVVRFQLETPSLPVFIPQAQIGQSDINRLIYSFTLTYNGYEFQQYVKYVPCDSSQQLPNPPISFQDLESNYYFVYTYQQWVTMLNKALSDAWAGLNSIITTLSPPQTLPSSNPPFFEFDPQGQLLILNADMAGYANTLAKPINIYCNAPCYTLINSFQALYYGYKNIINGKNFQLLIKNTNGTNELTLPSYTALQMYQEGSTTALWNPIQSLVFTTALLPVACELVSVPKVFNSDSNLFNTGNNANIQPILTDFVVEFNPNNTYRPNVVYTPAGEYRLIDLFGSSPLSAIELTCYWKDVFGGLHPFYLNSGCSGAIKIMFRRKDYNNVNIL
jgi:hypothetical protein